MGAVTVDDPKPPWCLDRRVCRQTGATAGIGHGGRFGSEVPSIQREDRHHLGEAEDAPASPAGEMASASGA